MPVDFFHQEFRSKRAGFPDLLRYSSIIRSGVVLGKGGELMASFRYRGPDLQCASLGELNTLRNQVNTLVKKLSSGWMLHTTTNRMESASYVENAAGAFPDAVTRAIEAERRLQYEAEGDHYENEYFLTFTYLPDVILKNRVKEFAFDSDNKSRFDPEYITRKVIEYFERQVGTFVGEIESVLGGKLYRLKARRKWDAANRRRVWFDEQLTYFHECLTGINQPIRLPDERIPVGVDSVIGAYEFYTGIRPRLSNRCISVVAIESPPDSGTQFGMLEVLNHLPSVFRWTTRWIAEDPEKAKAGFQKVRSKWRQKIRGFVADLMGKQGGAINMDAARMADDAEMAMSEVESGSVAYGYWSSVVVLMAESSAKLDVAVQYLLKNVRAAGFVCREETVNCTEAFLGSLPGHGYENLRRPQIHSMNLADCLPLTSIWQGPRENPCAFYRKAFGDTPVPPLFYGAASGGTPFRVVTHEGDVGHAFIGGPTGAGKSTLLGLMAASHFRYPGAKVFAFEKGESMLALCLAAGGQHYNFLDEENEGAATIGFAPFARIDKLGDRAWAEEYVVQILALHSVVADIDMKDEIRKALGLLATRPLYMRSFTNLAALVQTKEVRQVLGLYERDLAGGMLNAVSDSFTTSRFMVFEMEKLMEMGDTHVTPVLLYLFRMIERALDGSPVMIILDEAWLMLQHPIFQAKLKEWLKVLRKANAIVIFATQELQDVANSPIASTIFSACVTKILLPNPEAGSEENLKLYKSIALSDREIELLTYATKKRDYFFKGSSGRRLFQLELGPVALAFVAASGKEDRQAVKELYRIHGEKWVGYWLKRQGVNPAVLGGEWKLAA